MIKRPAILVLVCLIGTAMLGAETARQPLLREGFVLRGVEFVFQLVVFGGKTVILLAQQ